MLSADDIGQLFDYYFAVGCPCRSPRFRVAVALDFDEVGAREWTVTDVQLLLAAFDARMPLDVYHAEALATRATCRLCGSHIQRFGVPMFQDSFIERGLIEPGPLPDLGAPCRAASPICGEVFHAAPGRVLASEQRRIGEAYPRLGREDWLVYMKEMRDG